VGNPPLAGLTCNRLVATALPRRFLENRPGTGGSSHELRPGRLRRGAEGASPGGSPFRSFWYGIEHCATLRAEEPDHRMRATVVAMVVSACMRAVAGGSEWIELS